MRGASGAIGNVAAMVAGFRSDLYYRLNVFPLVLPYWKMKKHGISRSEWVQSRHSSRKPGKRAVFGSG